MWPLDSLRNDIPTARIILYGYDSHLYNSTCFQSLADLGNSLQKALQALYIGHTVSKTANLLECNCCH
jgi:hypothetical protein